MRRTMYIILFISVLVIALIGCTTLESSNQGTKDEDITEATTAFFHAPDYSRISSSELIEKMGEPTSIEEWTNKTLKADFLLATYAYDSDDIHYEFIIAEDAVVRVTLYSNEWWNSEGESFEYINADKSDIRHLFGISDLGEHAKVEDNNVNYKITQVSDKIARFNVIDIDSENKTFGLAKITYNLNYFDN